MALDTSRPTNYRNDNYIDQQQSIVVGNDQSNGGRELQITGNGNAAIVSTSLLSTSSTTNNPANNNNNYNPQQPQGPSSTSPSQQPPQSSADNFPDENGKYY
ncbi:hypothetical protein BLA29_007842 [Euroglyphus maynei]|uniref:Uncharacterized protein n=1 Tax=Euroglyphus maynei TaxID=6958 RepID=A0A1Y3BS19_EURMA|nr:hypothetical protein BLA29_007842 [Euroglyphus maynei]